MSQELFELCDAFQKIADIAVSKITIVENDDPLLKELSDIREFDKRIEFAKEQKGWELLGEGSARTAFRMKDGRVLKIAHNDKGISQNQVEMQPETQTDITNHILAADAKGKWLIVEGNEDITKEEFEELTGMSFNQFGSALFYMVNNESDEKEPKNYEEIKKNPFFGKVVSLLLNNDLLSGDISSKSKISSWGRIGDRIVLRDYGLSRSVWRSRYKTDSSSSNSSSDSKSTTTKTST